MEGRVFVRWEEACVSNEKGNRVVHYYLKRSNGVSDLAVIGRERSLRHMTYTVPNHFLRSMRPSSRLKWRSRREVVEWLSSLVAGSVSCGSYPQVDRFLDGGEPLSVDGASFEGLSTRKISLPSKGFLWLGSPWTCRKRRRHYQSFCRNGVTISVCDFVFVMAEEFKRLVAYLEDMYEDSRGNNMVVVRWFHKIDEVGIVLPPNFNDREIFSSLCLQDLSVECIDGLATVLSPQHFERFSRAAANTLWDPYMCSQLFDNDEVKPFDVTQVQGYWNQEFLKYVYSFSTSPENSTKPSKKRKYAGSLFEEAEKPSSNDFNDIPLPKKVFNAKPVSQFCVGSQVEVLCQDSGVRGCWFQAVIIKRHKEKVKVQYQDLTDADDTGRLQEWVSASRIAAVDKFGVHSSGRTTLRPLPPSVSDVKRFDVGCIVDARWHDGWWEGIVVQKQSEGKFFIYLPGEGKSAIFSSGYLRLAQDWLNNRWEPIKARPDLVHVIVSNPSEIQFDTILPPQGTVDVEEALAKQADIRPRAGPIAEPLNERRTDKEVSDLAKDNTLVQLKWSTSKKRKRRARGDSDRKRHSGEGSNSSSSSEEEGVESGGREGFVLRTPLKVDREACKYGRGHLFMASMPVSSLVMSR